jgi:hypothetical protein
MRLQNSRQIFKEKIRFSYILFVPFEVTISMILTIGMFWLGSADAGAMILGTGTGLSLARLSAYVSYQ